MLEGVMLLWFVLAAPSVAFVALDIWMRPESAVMKWGFVLMTAYIGPIGAFLYVWGCREPLPGLHERYAAVRWRQALGSTLLSVGGKGVGILIGAVLAWHFQIARIAEVALEYALGFLFGWTVFQAVFMRDIAGSYGRSLKTTFIPELLSMTFLMIGVVPVATLVAEYFEVARDPLQGAFWFRMSMALLAGLVVVYPMNWWLVARDRKYGITTVRAASAATPNVPMARTRPTVPRLTLVGMTLLSLAVFAAGVWIAIWVKGAQ